MSSSDDRRGPPGDDPRGDRRGARVETGVVQARRPRLAPLVWSEITVLFRRRRTLAMLAAVALIPILIAVAIRLSSSGGGGGPAFLGQITDNGLFVVVTAMVVATPLFLPLTIGVVAGDTIAGEAGHGTLRYLLIAPAGRAKLLLVKFIGAATFCAVAALTVIVVGIAIGALLFPIGPITLLSGGTIPVSETVGRFLAIGAYVAISLLGLSAVGLFISTLTDVPVGAMAATVTVSVAAQILGQLPQLSWLHPWLFTEHWLGFADILRDPISWQSFGDNALLQAGYVAVFGALAYGRFLTKDILS
ncbi:ABC transporter permease [Marisediminicola sp. LYQ134]|uniref:ABC transporter permease n=1 Tax=Marisediminicola sp. LYQ134 TaxID=3391061 RepID=UPI0039836F67